jgi:hypothetical protein
MTASKETLPVRQLPTSHVTKEPGNFEVMQMLALFAAAGNAIPGWGT